MKIPRVLYENVLRPLMFQLEPETAHHFAMLWLQLLSSNRLLMRWLSTTGDTRYSRTVFGVKFPNPVGLAAGFDKNCVALPAWEAMGFGFVEAGTVTARAQPGNPKPRIFRIPKEGALINRMGFNNDGADAVAVRLQRLKESGKWPRIPIGLNIGKTKLTPLEQAAEDYRYSFGKLFPYGDYFVLNVSSPNTPGLRTLQNKEALGDLMREVQKKNCELSARKVQGVTDVQPSVSGSPGPAKPLLVKIAPDLEFSQIEEILQLVEEHSLAGIIATNTTLDHSLVEESQRREGGLSGRPLRRRSTEIIKFIASRSSVPIIAVGGIDDVDSATEKFDAGAALIQVYTGFIYRGPRLAREICEGLKGLPVC